MDIINVRMHGAADNSPLEMISGARLAYLQRVELAAKNLVEALRSPSEISERETSSVALPSE